jgi:hypothetical protein
MFLRQKDKLDYRCQKQRKTVHGVLFLHYPSGAVCQLETISSSQNTPIDRECIISPSFASCPLYLTRIVWMSMTITLDKNNILLEMLSSRTITNALINSNASHVWSHDDVVDSLDERRYSFSLISHRER